MTNKEKENNQKVLNFMMSTIRNAYRLNKHIKCQEIIDSTKNLCSELKENVYGNFGPIKHILWDKADNELKQFMKNNVTNKNGDKIYQKKKWKIE